MVRECLIKRERERERERERDCFVKIAKFLEAGDLGQAKN
jgi:hypothetical protein